MDDYERSEKCSAAKSAVNIEAAYEKQQRNEFYSAIRSSHLPTQQEMCNLFRTLASKDDGFWGWVCSVYEEDMRSMGAIHQQVMSCIHNRCSVKFLQTEVAERAQFFARDGDSELRGQGFDVLTIFFYATMQALGVMGGKAHLSESVVTQAVQDAKFNMNKAFEGVCGWAA